ncbi:hypothetical protein E2493_12410 [Sphingomonas parva]|uniref:Uncharacterized protein n=1 Tax=Sphingomonas parva TaxID=2555898 RepID=A0A4Y8ZRR8_9SPHN|nr:hypothetical protein [Sphingomonas parva]TFI57992.1 hypothetical protein E2493_12410 [Sphingomonas parva]
MAGLGDGGVMRRAVSAPFGWLALAWLSSGCDADGGESDSRAKALVADFVAFCLLPHGQERFNRSAWTRDPGNDPSLEKYGWGLWRQAGNPEAVLHAWSLSSSIGSETQSCSLRAPGLTEERSIAALADNPSIQAVDRASTAEGRIALRLAVAGVREPVTITFQPLQGRLVVERFVEANVPRDGTRLE